MPRQPHNIINQPNYAKEDLHLCHTIFLGQIVSALQLTGNHSVYPWSLSWMLDELQNDLSSEKSHSSPHQLPPLNPTAISELSAWVLNAVLFYSSILSCYCFSCWFLPWLYYWRMQQLISSSTHFSWCCSFSNCWKRGSRLFHCKAMDRLSLHITLCCQVSFGRHTILFLLAE